MNQMYFTASDGAKLAYRDEGDGLPVLCLAGLTRNSADFDFLAPHFANVRLIRPDYRGRGASDRTGAATYVIPREAQDVLELLDFLRLEKAAIIGTSRGGLIAMFLAATAKNRLAGLCLNDIGPDIARSGLDKIKDYVGRNPAARTMDELISRLPAQMTGFANVGDDRWRAFAQRLYDETPNGLVNRYDPALRESFQAAFDQPPADLWPLFDACAGLPMALIRGANSDLLTPETVAEMRRRRSNMIFADVPDRAHVPFLDEPEALAAIRAWLEKLG
jgi:pimeloyl-ACP methyl ester carboxylesterase